MQHFDVLSFTQTWLSNAVDSSSILFDNYSIPFRKDRDDNHGGILVYVKKQYTGYKKTRPRGSRG